MSFEGEMDETTGQTAVATEAQMYNRRTMHTAANKPHKMCPNSSTWKAQKQNKLTFRKGITAD